MRFDLSRNRVTTQQNAGIDLQRKANIMQDVRINGVTRREFLRTSGLSGMGLFLGSALVAPSCLMASEPHPARMPLNDLTDEDEAALGDILAKDVEKDLAIVDSPLINSYLDGIVQKLAAASQRPNVPYRCQLVNADVLNAFSIPGGRIYIYRGLVDGMNKEDELVATLSHEIGHVVGRHSANKLIINMKARQAYDLVKNNIPAHAQAIQDFIEKIGGGLALLAMLQYSRENEYEADKLGFYETLRAGWDPNGFLTLFDMFIDLEKESKGLPMPLLRDHPPSDERAAAILKELNQVSVPKDASTDSLSFHAFHLAMNLLPNPPKPTPAPSPAPGSKLKSGPA